MPIPVELLESIRNGSIDSVLLEEDLNECDMPDLVNALKDPRSNVTSLSLNWSRIKDREHFEIPIYMKTNLSETPVLIDNLDVSRGSKVLDRNIGCYIKTPLTVNRKLVINVNDSPEIKRQKEVYLLFQHTKELLKLYRQGNGGRWPSSGEYLDLGSPDFKTANDMKSALLILGVIEGGYRFDYSSSGLPSPSYYDQKNALEKKINCSEGHSPLIREFIDNLICGRFGHITADALMNPAKKKYETPEDVRMIVDAIHEIRFVALTFDDSSGRGLSMNVLMDAIPYSKLRLVNLFGKRDRDMEEYKRQIDSAISKNRSRLTQEAASTLLSSKKPFYADWFSFGITAPKDAPPVSESKPPVSPPAVTIQSDAEKKTVPNIKKAELKKIETVNNQNLTQDTTKKADHKTPVPSKETKLTPITEQINHATPVILTTQHPQNTQISQNVQNGLLLSTEQAQTLQELLTVYSIRQALPQSETLSALALSLQALQARVEENENRRLSGYEIDTLKARIEKDRAEEADLLERMEMAKNPLYTHHYRYYKEFQTSFVSLMVGALAIGSAYVDINNGPIMGKVGWVADLLTNLFPRAKILVKPVTTALEHLENKSRKGELSSIKDLNGTIAGSELLGELIARFLVRAYVNDSRTIPKKSSAMVQEHCTTILKFIVDIGEPLSPDQETAKRLAQIVFGPHHRCNFTALPYTIAMKNSNISMLVSHDDEPVEHRVLVDTVNSLEKNEVSIEQQMKDLQKQIETLQDGLKQTQQSTASMEELRKTQKALSVLTKRVESSQSLVAAKGGLCLMSKNNYHDSSSETEDTRTLHTMMTHMEELTQQLLLLKEEFETVRDTAVHRDDLQSYKTFQSKRQTEIMEAFGASSFLIKEHKESVIQAMAVNKQTTEKRASEDAVNRKNTKHDRLQEVIKEALTLGTEQYLNYCHAQMITRHNSRALCVHLKNTAEKELNEQLTELINHLYHKTSSSSMDEHALDTYIINALKATLKPLSSESSVSSLYVKLCHPEKKTILTEKMISEIKVPRHFSGFTMFNQETLSTVTLNTYERERCRQALASLREEIQIERQTLCNKSVRNFV